MDTRIKPTEPGRLLNPEDGPCNPNCRQPSNLVDVEHASVKRAMRPDLIVESHIVCHPLVGVVDSLVGVEIDLLVFQAPPQPFYEDIVEPASRPVHLNLDAVRFQQAREFQTGELTPFLRPTISLDTRLGAYCSLIEGDVHDEIESRTRAVVLAEEGGGGLAVVAGGGTGSRVTGSRHHGGDALGVARPLRCLGAGELEESGRRWPRYRTRPIESL